MNDSEQIHDTAFGEEYPTWNDWFGDVVGGARWVYFPALHRNVDRDRGFFSKSDRELLLETQTLDLSNKTQRNARSRVRGRVLSAYFDARFLQFLSDRDRQLIFKNAREDRDGLDLRESFKEMVRFTYRGILEDEHEVDVTRILEQAVQEAEERYHRASGKNTTTHVEVNVTTEEGPGIERLEQRYANHSTLTLDELATLVSSEHFGSSSVDAADIDLADAIYYDARQPSSNPYQNSNRDRENAEKIVSWLRSFFSRYEIETRDGLEEATARLKTYNEQECDELLDKLDELLRVAPPFAEHLQDVSPLSERDSDLLSGILWPQDDLDVEEALTEEIRPPLSGEDWSPAADDDLHRFIARVEAARELTSLVSRGGDNGRERWEEVLSLAEFDESEWSDYMHEQLVEHCLSDLEGAIERENVDRGAVGDVDSWDAVLEEHRDSASSFRELDHIYSQDVLTEAWKALHEVSRDE